jgi:hypothetical protein
MVYPPDGFDRTGSVTQDIGIPHAPPLYWLALAWASGFAVRLVGDDER